MANANKSNGPAPARRGPFAGNHIANNYWNQSNSANGATRGGQQFCGFCKNNRESAQVYMSHRLKDDQNRVTCPQLRRYICPNCGATGDDAHTRSKCPNVVALREQLARKQQQQQPQHQHRPEAPADSNSGSSTPSTVASNSENDLVLGTNRGFHSMGRVTNSRYNSAGRLRNRPRFNMATVESCLAHRREPARAPSLLETPPSGDPKCPWRRLD